MNRIEYIKRNYFDLLEYLRDNLDDEQIGYAMDEIIETGEPLYRVDNDLHTQIVDLCYEWIGEQEIPGDELMSFDTQDILFAL